MVDAVLISSELQKLKSDWLTSFKADLTTMQVGDSGTTPLESDTAIGNLIGSAAFDSIDESVADQITFNVKFGITSFVGSTLRESTLATALAIKTHSLSVEALKGGDQIFWLSSKAKITAINKVVT
jgi:hypothetical protein